jgi:hypothetical protein
MVARSNLACFALFFLSTVLITQSMSEARLCRDPLCNGEYLCLILSFYLVFFHCFSCTGFVVQWHGFPKSTSDGYIRISVYHPFSSFQAVKWKKKRKEPAWILLRVLWWIKFGRICDHFFKPCFHNYLSYRSLIWEHVLCRLTNCIEYPKILS